MGWRYLLFILGALTLILSLIRFFVFNLLESPRFLVGIGNDQGAVDVIHQMAAYNSTTTSLSLEDLTGVEERHTDKKGTEDEKGTEARSLLSKTSVFTLAHIKALFATRKMAISTSMLIALWGIIGLASTLYNSFLPFL
jgi:hypothetical protein